MTINVDPIAVNDPTNLYYKNVDLLTAYPEKYLRWRCKKAHRLIIDRLNIPIDSYQYSTLPCKSTGMKWTSSTPDNKRSILLLKKEWVDANFFADDGPAISKPTHIPIQLLPSAKLVSSEMQQVDCLRVDMTLNDLVNNVSINTAAEKAPVITTTLTTATAKTKQTIKIFALPPLLVLEDHEKFHDEAGNIGEVETRGTRGNREDVYFYVKDISALFILPKLTTTLVSDRGYMQNIDYKCFIRHQPINDGSVENGQILKPFKVLYLTYSGLLRVLLTSRNNPVVDKFRKWAEDILFTAQMGTTVQKEQLSAKLVGINVLTLRAVLDVHTSIFPMVYMWYLGKVGPLRKTFNIGPEYGDDLNVYKYGFTNDARRRSGEIQSKYGGLPGVTLQLVAFNIVDVKFAREAEHEIKLLCEGFNKNLVVLGPDQKPKYKELIVLDGKDELERIKSMYGYVGKKYAGATADIQAKLQEAKEREIELSNTIEIQKKDICMLNKDLEFIKLEFIKLQRDTDRQIFDLQLRLARGNL